MSKESNSGPILDFSLLDGPEESLEFHRVGSVGDFRPGTARVVRVGLKQIAIFNREGRFFALNNACPHAGSSLAAGDINNGRVVCARHGWAFDLATGSCPEHPVYNAKTYDVDLRGNEVWIGIPMDR